MSRAVSTRHDWRFFDGGASEPQPIPQSWITKAREEPVEPDERAVYAIQVKAGVELLVEVGATGDVINGPLKERNSLLVLYVTADGTPALERTYRAFEVGFISDSISRPSRHADGRPPRSSQGSVTA